MIVLIIIIYFLLSLFSSLLVVQMDNVDWIKLLHVRRQGKIVLTCRIMIAYREKESSVNAG